MASLLEAIGGVAESAGRAAKRRVAESVGGFSYDIDAKTVGRVLFGESKDDRIKRMHERVYGPALARGDEKPWKEGDLESGRKVPIRVAERIDLINMAAGLPQEHNTIKESGYIPGIQKEKKEGEKFYTFRDTNQIKSIYEGLKQYIPEMERKTFKKKYENTKRIQSGKEPEGIMFTVGYPSEVKSGEKDYAWSQSHVGMERFQVGVGEDEKGKYISIFDPWDIDYPGAEKVFSSPPNLYDRYYYEKKKKPMTIKKPMISKKKIKKVKTKFRDRTQVDDRVFGFLKKSAGKVIDWATEEVEKD